jgi:hypothetical protein
MGGAGKKHGSGKGSAAASKRGTHAKSRGASGRDAVGGCGGQGEGADRPSAELQGTDQPTGGKPVKKGTKAKKGGWHSWGAGNDDDLAAELAALGLRIKSINADGNCFFRALGDQLEVSYVCSCACL